MDRIPQAYGYARVSDSRQADRDESIPQQTARCLEYYKLRLAPTGVYWQGVESDSFGVSASKKDFAMRPAGIRLINKLRAGDHLIFDKPDRVWRSLSDYCALCEWFKLHEINVHFVSIGFDTSTPFGEFALTLMVAVAKLESEMNGARVKASNEIRRKEGKPTTTAPLGTHIVLRGRNKKRKKYLVWHEQRRAIMAKIVEIRSRRPRPNFARISDEIESHLAYKAGRSFNVKSAWQERFWSIRKCEDGFCCEVYLRDHAINSVCDIPKMFRDTARAYCAKLGLLGGR